MNLSIRYKAIYQYESEASFSPHTVRLFPRSSASLQIRRIAFSTNESANIQHRVDLFDNVTAFCFYPDLLDHLDYRLEIDLSLTPRNAFNFILNQHAVMLPFEYSELERTMLAPYRSLQTQLGFIPDVLKKPTSPVETVDTLVALNEWFFKNIEYERRDEGDAYPPEETLRLMKGSCRDYAVLLVEVLRSWGLAARLASGYLWEDDTPDSPRRAENALHAWVEAYLPGAGWLGMDPTNGVFCDHHFIAAAVGLTHAQISPVEGHYYGKKSIASTLDTDLRITEDTTQQP